jgi:tripartite-type tricarboxylate transporter receptor subunit TctC
MRRLSIALSVLFSLVGQTGIASAQPAAWPTKPVTFIVAYPAGGTTDVVARVVAKHLSDSLGQQVLVENRPGAGGTIGANYVAKARPDGYQLLFGAAAEITIAPVTRKNLPYNPEKAFEPVTLVDVAPFLLVTDAKLPPNNLAEFIAYAKEHHGQLNYSSFGANTTNFLFTELFKRKAGIDAVHVPYKGSAPSVIALLGGQVEFTFDTLSSVLSQVRAGKLKAIAWAAPERSSLLPNVPTFSESGMPGFVGGTFQELLAPTGTPKSIVNKLNTDVQAILKLPDVRKAFANRGVEPKGGTPDELADFLHSEINKWQKLANEIGLKPE